ncbi:hypothetical protein PYCCODRAFT_171693 [Trametes coccinea BRFM310]|uniref:Uncharacterized protein n=1 Tax=Trametes coccinea (strain BRFM310) TaxID=1353009 RepID=A0A1Y2ISH1_TRAC3|nr:hypothetical protein PYCCODRAFT_171693 [Trametes coccinea BRFM310]
MKQRPYGICGPEWAWPTPPHPILGAPQSCRQAGIAVVSAGLLFTSFWHPMMTNLLARACQKSPSPRGRLRPTELYRQTVGRACVVTYCTLHTESRGRGRHSHRALQLGKPAPSRAHRLIEPSERPGCSEARACEQDAPDRHSMPTRSSGSPCTHARRPSPGPVLVGTASRNEWATRTVGTCLIARRRGRPSKRTRK